jgi:hypothetical protein
VTSTNDVIPKPTAETPFLMRLPLPAFLVVAVVAFSVPLLLMKHVHPAIGIVLCPLVIWAYLKCRGRSGADPRWLEWVDLAVVVGNGSGLVLAVVATILQLS